MTDDIKPAALNASTKVLTVRYEHGGHADVHLLNVGEVFERFGGSSRGLQVRKTASLITRDTAGGCWNDLERDLRAPEFWTWIQKLIDQRAALLAAARMQIKVIDGDNDFAASDATKALRDAVKFPGE